MAMKNTGRPKDATNPLSHGAKPVYCRRFGGIHDQDAWAPNEIANGRNYTVTLIPPPGKCLSSRMNVLLNSSLRVLR